jgi:predicted ArsR family transcriptional regulator
MSEFERKKKEAWKTLEEKIASGLQDAPVYKGFRAKELAEKIDMPEPTARWHLELLERSGTVQSTYVGKAKLYRLTRKE